MKKHITVNRSFNLSVAGSIYNDDILLNLGTDADIALLNRSTILAADGELTSVIVGTSEHPGVAANSFILSNITASGDLLFLVNKGGHSQGVFWADGSTGDTAILAASGQSVDMYIGGSKVFDLTNDGTKSTLMGLTGDYWRIGDAGTTAHSLNSEDDLYISGELEVKGNVFFDNAVEIKRGTALIFGGHYTFDSIFDANAVGFLTALYTNGNNVPSFMLCERAQYATDWGLMDGITQPTLSVIEKDGKYQSALDANVLTGNKDELLYTGAFASCVVGDVVRITAGTNVTTGWYWITDISGANDSVTLDRDMCTDSANNDLAFVMYHDFTMLSADGICTRITDGAPSDASVEIDRPGWLILDVGGAANGRLYWRPKGTTWRYVDATGGLSMTAEEKVDKNGHEFQMGDKVELVIDRINEDGSFHAEPIYAGRN